MKDIIVDMDIDIFKKKVHLVTQSSGIIVRDFSFLNSISNLNIISESEQNLALRCVSSVKKSLLEKIRALSSSSFSNDSFKNALYGVESSFLKKELGLKFSSLEEEEAKLLKDFCYIDQKFGVKNSLYFSRYFGKEDILFSSYGDFDEYNAMLNSLNDGFVDTLLFCEFNNLKAINHLYGEDVGDNIIKSFIGEIDSLYDNPFIIRYGNDEFVLLCDEPMASQIEDLINNKEFLDAINKDIHQSDKHLDVEVFSTVSSGKSSLHIPASVLCKDDIVEFKKRFSASYLNANLQSLEKKEELKKRYGHEDLKNFYRDNKAILEYHAHLINLNTSMSDQESNSIVDEFLSKTENKSINLNNLGFLS